MKYYILDMPDIDLASKNGIVVCWSDIHDRPVTEVNELSSRIFADKVIVDEVD